MRASVVAGSTRFKAFRKYVYQYTAESRNGVVGVANLRNGPKIFCQVPTTGDPSSNIVSPIQKSTYVDVSVYNLQMFYLYSYFLFSIFFCTLRFL